MTDLLLKAVFQKQLTPDTVEIQFCSDWLKDQITDLFTKISLMEEELKWRRGVHVVTGVDELKRKLDLASRTLESQLHDWNSNGDFYPDDAEKALKELKNV